MVRGFGFAFMGIIDLIRIQRNAQVHLFIIIVLIAVSLVWRISAIEWVCLILTMTLVLSLEAMNTAIEAVVDLASPEYHLLAKRAKDVAAGAVLIGAIGAVFIALIIFGPRLLVLLTALVS